VRNLQKTNGNEKLAQVIQTAVPDGQLGSFLEQLNMAQQRLMTVQKEFGSEHVEVLKATDAVADLHQKIADRVDGIMLGLDARVASLKEGLKILTDEVSNAKSNDIAMTTLSRPYWDASTNSTSSRISDGSST